jgi:simple sugar transport system permease protein
MFFQKREGEPWVRTVKRADLSFWRRVLVRTICLASACALSVILLAIIGQKDPFPAVAYLFQGSFQNQYKFEQSLEEMVLLLGIAVALAPAYQMRFWNVGAQGQILLGALGTALVMIYASALPSWLVILLSLAAALAFGGIWGAIPAFFKAKWNTNETLFTLMMNYIAIQLVAFATLNWKGANSSMGLINSSTKVGWLPEIANIEAILPLILVGCLVVGMTVYLRFTKHGYELKVIGKSLDTARYTGVKVRWSILRTMILSGALCGLIGFIYVAGIEHKISTDLSGDYGFTAIIVAWLASFDPLIMIVFSSLIVFLNRGAINLSNVAYAPALNDYSCEVLVFFFILSIMLSEFFIRYRLAFRHRERAKAGAEVAKHE